MTVYFTADHHFGHANILEYCNRPFDSVEEMDAVMIWRWNEVVQPEDMVYHLGDFTLGDARIAQEYFGKLSGIIKVLANPWHHDKRWLPIGNSPTYYSMSRLRFVRILPSMDVLEFPELSKTEWPQVIVLCHYPLAEWDRKHHGAWHLHGHSHGKFVLGSGVAMLDVGVDSHNFYPVSLERIAELINENLGREVST